MIADCGDYRGTSEVRPGAFRRWGLDLLLIVVVALAGAASLAGSYQKWMHPLIDIGRELYVPQQLLEGEKLYRDIRYNYPPLPPYSMAALVRGFGNNLTVFAAFGAVIGAIVAATLYVTGRLLAGPVGGGIAALLFCSLNLTAEKNSNFIFPWAYAATLGVMFSLLFLFFLLRYLFLGRETFNIVLSFLFAVLAAWCKVEFTLYVGLLLLVSIVVHRIPLRPILLLVFAMGATLLFVSLVFSDSGAGKHWLWDNVLESSIVSGPAARNLWDRVGGWAEWPRRSAQIAVGAGLVAAIVAMFYGVDRLGRTLSRWSELLLAAFLAVIGYWMPDDLFFRGWSFIIPLLLVLMTFVPAEWPSGQWAEGPKGNGNGLAQRPRPLGARGPLILLLVGSLALSLRVLMNLAPTWYGVVLIVPTYLLIVSVLFTELPRRGVYSQRRAWLWVPFFAGVALCGLVNQRALYRQSRFPVVTSRGVFYDSVESRARVLNEFLRYAERMPARSMVVIPEGVSLNYFARCPNPTGYYLFIPAETANPAIERRVISSFERTRPERVVLVRRDLAEFGSAGFGVDYDRELAGYVRSHYEVEKAWNVRFFDLTVLRRK